MRRLRARTVAAIAVALLLAPAAARAQNAWSATLGPEVAGAQGTGSVLVSYDPGISLLSITANWSGLSAGTTVAHIHCCVPVPNTGTVGVAVTPGTLPGFPVGVTSGSYLIGSIDLTSTASYTAAFLTASGGTAQGARNALLGGMNNSTAYFNIHTTAFPGGEIRGFLTAVPEPSTYALMATGLAGVGLAAWRRRRV